MMPNRGGRSIYLLLTIPRQHEVDYDAYRVEAFSLPGVGTRPVLTGGAS